MVVFLGGERGLFVFFYTLCKFILVFTSEVLYTHISELSVFFRLNSPSRLNDHIGSKEIRIFCTKGK